MKITLSQLFLSFVLTGVTYAGSTKGQSVLDKTVNLSAQSSSLEDMLTALEHIVPVKFVYSRNIVPASKQVTIEGRQWKLASLLNKMLTPEGIGYEISNGMIVLSRLKPGEVPPVGMPATAPPGPEPLTAVPPGHIIKGTVTDAKGEGLPGVAVILKGSNKGVLTDPTGHYQLEVPDNAGILVFKLIGYVTQEVPVAAAGNVRIKMELAATDMNEIVVVGYGTQKKTSITGAVATINTKELKQAPTSNLSNALVGLMPGLIAQNTSGKPGAGSSISIRGKSTWGNNDALIVVDGVVRPFDQLDPNEVESVTILKDAAAAAVYGARAANGVVLVTTRRGHTGKPKFNYSGYAGVQQPTRYPKLMSAYEYAQTNNAARINAGQDPSKPQFAPLFYTADQMADFRSGKVGTDWYAASFRKTSMQTQHNLTIDGGSENIKYFFSGGYLSQDGMYNNISYNRYSFRSNVDARINKTLTITVDIDGRIGKNRSPEFTDATIFGHVIRQKPVFNAYNPDGTPKNTTGEHPVEEINSKGYMRNELSTFFGTISFKQDLNVITKGLNITGRYNYNKNNNFRKEFDVPYTMYDLDASGKVISTKTVGKNLTKTELSQAMEQNSGSTVNLALNYTRNFGRHNLSGLLLYEQFTSVADTFNAYRTNYPSILVDQLGAGGAIDRNNDGYAAETGRRSYVGRVSYDYDARYLLETSFRYDGSANFPKGRRYGFFPAVSAGWRISEENFFKNSNALRFVDNLKLRASYGVLGNDRVPNFQYNDYYTFDKPAVFDGKVDQSVIYGPYPNLNITWEKAKTTDIGLEALLFKGKLGFEADYFYKRTSDILRPRTASVPGTFGRQLPDENYAVVDNTGFEVSVNHRGNIGKLNYFIKANGSYAHNTVIVLDEGDNTPFYRKRKGKPIDYIYGLRSDGLFQSAKEVYNSPVQYAKNTAQPGDIKYLDLNGDGMVDDYDMTVLSYDGSTPKVILGLYISADWKGFDLGMLFQGAFKSNMMLSGTGRNMFDNGGNSNSFAYLLDYWTPDNPGAAYPRAYLDRNSNNDRDSDFWLKKTGYVRLKSFELGYTIPKQLLRGIERLRIYASGLNVFTIDQFKLFDPESTAGKGNYYPQQKNYNIGVNLTF
ncbi:TonB-dependent receptor [Chitinophaga sp. HK235]|uniref:SusC/RagA family TonB-linked outer membrane protein n=1 Tax=Chitinophaga sp. HK235 TaxID=2952571 RepID=UPI001BA8EBEF|nr:TonB-dependent receptor [Chitinophaga sp. HK235]